MTVLLVCVGGVIGVLARYGISYPFHGDALPWVTCAINVAGSFLLGVLVVVNWFSPELRTALGVGLLGGFTTFSTFSVQVVLDIEAGEPGRALFYLGLSIALGVAAAVLGYLCGKSLAG